LKESKNGPSKLGSKAENFKITAQVVARKFHEDKEYRTQRIPNKKRNYKNDIKDWLESWPDY
jgi:hypothetical protein